MIGDKSFTLISNRRKVRDFSGKNKKREEPLQPFQYRNRFIAESS
jgi:hypothetical protein